jgi:ABC-2 type transport system permease protein
MPLLMIFLTAALTMRQWSEEQQTGTLEVLLTMPIRIVQLVAGKFLAVLTLVALTLLLTIFLPITISQLGNLDWGPVVGGYVAALLVASAYIAIGLFVSSRTDNQIVSLILNVLICGVLHLVGTSSITNLFDSSTADFLRSISTSSRFESIERGVIDLRDLLYYLSLTAGFLALNILSLDSRRWSKGIETRKHRLNNILAAGLVALNVLALNVWLSPFNAARADLTEDRQYSLSQVTRDLLDNLQEPLLIRAYLSEENHPLLEPLIPQVRDMLEEYEVAAGGDLTVEVLDPLDDPELENEAYQTYGISAIPLEVSDRSGRSIINVYFDILIRYGDQSEVLNFQDLIAVDQYGDDAEIRLRNFEYDLTGSIKRVVQGFQSLDAVLASLETPAALTLYVTESTLPSVLADVPATIATVAEDIESQSDGVFSFETVDVSSPDSPVTADYLFEQYGIQAIAISPFSMDTYYLHMVLTVGDQAQILYLTGDLSESEIRTAIESGLKRFSSGFLTVVGILTPNIPAEQDIFGQTIEPLQSYDMISSLLQEQYEVQSVDLSGGQVPADIDALVVIAPEGVTDLERYAIDQYLMRGGSVFVAAGNYRLIQDSYSGELGLTAIEDNLGEMLAGYGVTVEDTLVLDPQNETFPMQTYRDAGGVTISEYQLVDYPFSVDVRSSGMDSDSPIVSDLTTVTMNWASPISLDDELLADRDVTYLLQSSSDSWLTENLDILPDSALAGGFAVEGEQQAFTLAVALQGPFDSYFTDRELPFEVEDASAEDDEAVVEGPQLPDTGEETEAEEDETDLLAAMGTLTQSPESARLVVVSSSEFINDVMLSVSAQFNGDRYLNSLQLVQNIVDWFVEDTELASIRSRDAATRVLNSLTEDAQHKWEVANYALALLSLGALAVVWQLRKRAEQPMVLVLPGQDTGEQPEPPSASS